MSSSRGAARSSASSGLFSSEARQDDEDSDTYMVGEQDVEDDLEEDDEDDDNPILDEDAPSAAGIQGIMGQNEAPSAFESPDEPMASSARTGIEEGYHHDNGAASGSHTGGAFGFQAPERQRAPKRGKPPKPTPIVQALMGEAHEDYMEGKYHEALEKCREIQGHPSAPHDAYHLMGRIYEELGEEQNALETFEALSKIAPKDEANWKKLGEMYQNTGTTEALQEAIRCFRKSVKLNKNDTEALTDLAFLYTTTKEYKSAVRILRKLLTYPEVDLPNIYLQLAENLYRLKNVGEAIEMLEQCMEYCLGERISGVDKDSSVSQAPNESRFRVEYINEAYHAVNMVCELYSSQGAHKSIIHVIKQLEVVLANKATDREIPIDLKCKLAIAQLWEDEANEAHESLKGLWQCSVAEYADLYWEVAEAFRQTGRPESALVFYEALRNETSYDTPTTWKSEAECHRALGRLREESSRLRQIVGVEPNNFESAMRLMVILISELGEHQEAHDLVAKQSVLNGAPIAQRLIFLAETALLFLQATVDPNIKTNPTVHALLKLRSTKRKDEQSATLLVEEIQSKVEVNLDQVVPASAWTGFVSVAQDFATTLRTIANSEKFKNDTQDVTKKIGLNNISQIVQYLCVTSLKSGNEAAAEEAIDTFLTLPKSRRAGQPRKPTSDKDSVLGEPERAREIITYTGSQLSTGNLDSRKEEVARLQNIAFREPTNRRAWNVLAAYYKIFPELFSKNALRQKILRMIQLKGESVCALLMLGHISHDKRCFGDSAVLYLRAHCLTQNSSPSEDPDAGDPLISFCLAAALLQKAVLPRNLDPSKSIVKMLAWYGHYRKLRTSEVHQNAVGLPLWMMEAECNYNLGRLYHHLGFTNLAISCYDAVLLARPHSTDVAIAQPEVHEQNKTPSALDGDCALISADTWDSVGAFGANVCFDIRMEAAYNLVVILQQTKTESSLSIAKRLSERFLVVDSPERPIKS